MQVTYRHTVAIDLVVQHLKMKLEKRGVTDFRETLQGSFTDNDTMPDNLKQLPPNKQIWVKVHII